MYKRQIQAKVKEAEQYAEEDKKRKEEVEIRNRAETLVYETEKSLKEIDASLTDDEKTAINAAKDELSKALEGTDIEDIKDKTEKLTEQFHTISTKLYQQAQANGAAGAAGGFDPNNMGAGAAGAAGAGADNGAQGAPNDNVVDADFEVVDDEENK